MIDIHFHCLPGIDDGPSTWEEAVELCRAAEAEGTETIVATPHVMRDPWINEDRAERDRLLVRLNDLLGGKPAVVPGCEMFFSSDVIELWEHGNAGPLVGLNRGTALLLEFPTYSVAPQAEWILHELSVMGVQAVIAHPERNAELARNPKRLASLVAKGAMTQITAASLLGDFGRGPLAAAEDFFARGLVHIVASDAHSIAERPPRLAAARRWAEQRWGTAATLEIFATNPKAVTHGVVAV
ncbi:MAG TPA: CpsB/CapC family capsule biosynthesis tyrosine phosphatase [Thermoanaerobaculia bacterium]|nr:CpsB/CapC family capsule biosynthesis tyrosine phosphatase [Thermoanaerobaculia bacterium]